MSAPFRTSLVLAAFGLASALPVAAQTTPPDTPPSAPADTLALPAEPAAPVTADRSQARALFNEGSAFQRTNNYTDARARYEQAITIGRAAQDTQTVEAAQRALGALAYLEASAKLQANPLPPLAAQEALPLLDEARTNGYTAPGMAYNYARVYNALERHADAIPHAEAAVAANSESDDLSPYYIELGVARRGAGDIAGARTAFESARTGAWASWAEHYLGQLDEAEGGEPEGDAPQGDGQEG